MDLLYQDAYDMLKDFYPSTLDGWESLSSHYQRHIRSRRDCLDVAAFALELGISDILATACFTSLIVHPLIELRHKDIPPQLWDLLVRGRERLVSSLPMTTLRWVADCMSEEPGRWKCRNDAECSAFRRFAYRLRLSCDTQHPLEYIFLPFQCVVDNVLVNDALGNTPELCSQCLEEFQNKHEDGRYAAWDALPLAFDVYEWPK